MAPDSASAQQIDQGRRCYRLCDAAVITQDGNGYGPDRGAYAKNNTTGALFRMGHAETLLLTGLGSGFSVDAMCKAFAHRLQITITPDAVEEFAQDMVTRGLLEELEQGTSEPAAVKDTASAGDHSLSGQGPDAPDGDAAEEAEGPYSDDDLFGDSPDDEIATDLSDAVFFEDDFTETLFEEPGAGAKKRQSPPPPRGPANPKITQRAPRFEDSAPKPVRTMAIRLFNPTGLLGVLNALFGWIAHLFSWLILPVAVVALLSIFHRLDEVLTTLTAGFANLGLAGLLALSMLTVNLATRLVMGAVIQREGAEVPGFGITFMFFVIPRFAVDTTNLFRLEREGRMRVFASALKTRLLIFALCTFFWDGSRLGGTGFSEFVALLAQISLFSFLISAFPLLSGEGYRLMTAYFDEPLLRERSLGLLFGRGKNSKLPPVQGRQWWVFLLYGLSIVIFTAFIVTLAAAYASTALVGRFGGTGAIMFVSLIGLMLLWLLVTKSQSRRLHTQIARQIRAERKAASDAILSSGNDGAWDESRQLPVPVARNDLVPSGRSLTLPAATSVGTARPLPGLYAKNAGTRWGVWVRRGLLVSTLVTLLFVAFLPYQYDAGGDFAILPDTRVQVIARVPGELAEVLVDEGDTVQAGEVLARQQGIEERYALAVAKAALAKAEAQFETLQSGATPEELRVAEEQVSRVEVELPFLEAEAERADELLERGAIPQSQAEAIKSRFETAKADLRTAQANLENVQALAQESEIAASRADIDRLSAEVAYYEQLLKDTEIVAPVPGRVVIINEKPVRGTYLQTGELLMEIEDHRFAQAEIQLPETDISLIKIGQLVRLKSWAMPGKEWVGTVASIAPVAERQEFGQVVRVRTRLANDDGSFRPGMTGFAKIEGPEMRVWEAYSRLFVRFVLVEIWGWIP
ncbi:HlyD family secretion protein [Sulfitobacter sp. JB4-11]|uniref:HlyD family secretion protein n=1 Tax=Sulfitobacter rhodophyticola TaxID=3238304 RepID=UPI0035186A59